MPNDYSIVFQPLNLKFNILDLFKVPRIATKAKKIFIALPGVILMYLVLFIANYLILYVNGCDLNTYWNYHRFFLFQNIHNNSIISLIIISISFLIALNIFLLIVAGITKITIEECKGNKFISIKQSYKFMWENKFSILFPSFGILIILLCITIVWYGFAFIYLIPWFGPIIFWFLYLFYFFSALFFVFTCCAWIISIIYGPTIFTSWGGDAFAVIFQSYSLLWSQPIRLFIYSILNVIISCTFICFLILTFWGILNIIEIFFSQSFLLNYYYNEILQLASHFLLPKGLLANEASILDTISYYLLAIWLAFIFSLIIAIFISNIVTGKTLIFTILKKIESDINLLTLN